MFHSSMTINPILLYHNSNLYCRSALQGSEIFIKSCKSVNELEESRKTDHFFKAFGFCGKNGSRYLNFKHRRYAQYTEGIETEAKTKQLEQLIIEE